MFLLNGGTKVIYSVSEKKDLSKRQRQRPERNCFNPPLFFHLILPYLKMAEWERESFTGESSFKKPQPRS